MDLQGRFSEWMKIINLYDNSCRGSRRNNIENVGSMGLFKPPGGLQDGPPG